jgi:hypothetical protein
MLRAEQIATIHDGEVVAAHAEAPPDPAGRQAGHAERPGMDDPARRQRPAERRMARIEQVGRVAQPPESAQAVQGRTGRGPDIQDVHVAALLPVCR